MNKPDKNIVFFAYQDIPDLRENGSESSDMSEKYIYLLFHPEEMEPLPDLTGPLRALKANIHAVGQPPLAWMKEVPFCRPFSQPMLSPLFDEDLAMFRAAYAAQQARVTLWLDFQPALGTEKALFYAGREAWDEDLLTSDEAHALWNMLEPFLDIE